MRIANKRQNSVINFHQEFVASTHDYFFQGQTGRGLFLWPIHHGESWLQKQEEE
jgi:hypothetical protein